MSTFVGIDIAAKHVDVVIRTADSNGRVETFGQTPQAHRQLVGKLLKLRPACVVMEATGIYFLDLARALFAAGLPVSVINPKRFKHFAELMLKNTKTDGVDAALLAEYAQRMRPSPWTAPEDTLFDLRDMARQINRLTDMNTQAKNRLHALTATRQRHARLIEDEQEGIAFTERRIARLRDLALEIIQANARLKRQLENLTQAVGIGQNAAICMMGELNVLPNTLKAPQVCHYAGLSVRLNQSGSSLNRPGRLSKAGNTYLRSAFFMPAMSAGTHDPRARAFKDALLRRGKKKMQAICAIMRKYLMGVWACIKLDVPFDSAKLFSQKLKNACG